MSLPPIHTKSHSRTTQTKATVDVDVLVNTLKVLERSFSVNKIEKVRTQIIKKVYEELAFPPADIVGTTDWLEETMHVSITTAQVINLFAYVNMFMPHKYMHPKQAVPHLLANCSLKVPTSRELLDLIEKFGVDAVNVTSVPRLATIRRSAGDSQMSQLFSYISGKWNYRIMKQQPDKETTSAIAEGSPGACKSVRRNTHTGSSGLGKGCERYTGEYKPSSHLPAVSAVSVTRVRAFSSSDFSDIGSAETYDHDCCDTASRKGKGSLDESDVIENGIPPMRRPCRAVSLRRIPSLGC